MKIKNPFSLLAVGIQDRIKSAFFSMQQKFKSESNRLRLENIAYKKELQRSREQLADYECAMQSLAGNNEDLKNKLSEAKKSWFLLQSTSANAAKIQKLIDSYKRIKAELLELRKKCDCSINDFGALQQENNRLKILTENLSADGKVDINALLDTISTLKKENYHCNIKCEHLEHLVKNIKKNEQKLANVIKSKQVL
jgi:hypothetical protein